MAAGEVVVPGDFDGDNKADVAVWNASSGLWTYWRSIDGTQVTPAYWGGSAWTDRPATGDYDGDGKTDIAIWRNQANANGLTEFWIILSSNSNIWSVEFGVPGDIPVQGDYDGDGKTDFAVVRPSNGNWYFLKSEAGYGFSVSSGPAFSASDDWPVPADYNGDSKTDIAVWFKATGEWFIVDSQTQESRSEILGRPNEKPVQAFNVFKQ